MQWYFCFFLVSGFCSILYEIVWLRISMAQFGVTTAMVSLVLSAFMVGLGVGCWGAGLVSRKHGPQFPALKLYALAELLIGVSAIAVPVELAWGRELLIKTFPGMSLSTFYFPSAVWLAATLVPWCACMGATFPFMMAAIKQEGSAKVAKAFSYLYLPNIIGATGGAVLPLFLIELFGFHRTLHIAAVLNVLLAATAFSLSFFRRPAAVMQVETDSRPQPPSAAGALSGRAQLLLLFATGLTSMGIEVVWVRLYTPSLGTLVYAFAAILGLYLVAMDVGSWICRRTNRDHILDNGLLWVALGFSVIFPFVTADPRLHVPAILREVLGILPFSVLVGFVTPAVLDRFSRGNPERAGTGYAINIAGCVLGPLVAGFVLLPIAGERLSLCILALPWFYAGFKYRPGPRVSFAALTRSPYFLGCCVLTLGSMAVAFSSRGYEQRFWPRLLRRDSTATVIAYGSSRESKRLLINGVGMTMLTPDTKIMVHLPNALLSRPPQSGLTICFGMGSTQLSMLSWGIPSTAVELVPSVPGMVTFFHPNAAPLMSSPLSHVVIDDGRFFLERSSEQYDVITVDPPPPVSAAGSSLLYSKEFYATAQRHLRPGGILQQWFPGGEPATTAAVARAIKESFPFVRAFGTIEGPGIHFLASVTPIPQRSASELAAKLPRDAARDLMEWGPASTPEEQFGTVLNRELSLDAIVRLAPGVPAVQDDHAVNEYFLLRRLSDREFQRQVFHYVF
jgi:predicted membrane-bound spermidine synthase